MSKENLTLRDELNLYKCEFGLTEKIPCSKADNEKFMELVSNGGQLPQSVYRYKDVDTGQFLNEFYIMKDVDLTQNELEEYLTYKKLKLLNTIKNCVLFFTVLTIITLVISFIFGISIAENF